MVSLILTRSLSCSQAIGGNRGNCGKFGAGAASPETGAKVLASSCSYILVLTVTVRVFFLTGDLTLPPDSPVELSFLLVPAGFSSGEGSPDPPPDSGKTSTISALSNSLGGLLRSLWQIASLVSIFCLTNPVLLRSSSALQNKATRVFHFLRNTVGSLTVALLTQMAMILDFPVTAAPV